MAYWICRQLYHRQYPGLLCCCSASFHRWTWAFMILLSAPTIYIWNSYEAKSVHENNKPNCFPFFWENFTFTIYGLSLTVWNSYWYSVCVQYNIVSMCCVGRKKVRGKVTIYFFHIYYTLESHSVYNIFVLFLFLFLTFSFVFSFICLCVFLFCFCFDIYSWPWLWTKFDLCLIDMYSIPTPSKYKGMILIETLIYENQNLTH
jgi:hypothetical protein